MTKEQIIDQVLTKWAEEFLQDLKVNAGRLPSDTGDGTRSFVINAETSSDRATMMLSFKEYLRYFDMRNNTLRRDKDFDPAGMERMKDWVKRNLGKLMSGYTHPVNYKYKDGQVPESRIINNIAWGISKKRERLKRRQWYTKLKAQKQYALYYRLLDELLPAMLAEAKSRVK